MNLLYAHAELKSEVFGSDIRSCLEHAAEGALDPGWGESSYAAE